MRSRGPRRRFPRTSKKRSDGRSRSAPAVGSARRWGSPPRRTRIDRNHWRWHSRTPRPATTVVSDGQVQLLFEEFTAAQIVELLMWVSFEYAGQMFGCLIGDEPATAEEKEAFAAAISSA